MTDKKFSIVQVHPEKEVFGGCMVVVTEVKPWGIQGYVQSAGVNGQQYIRLTHGEYEPTGVHLFGLSKERMMTDKMIQVPRGLLEELRDCANDCFSYESTLSYSRSTRVNFYEDLVERCDALLRAPAKEAVTPAAHTDNEGEPLDEAVRKSWSRYCNAFAKSPDAPYPGMIESFERHYSQDFRDPEWRSEAGTWAAAWKSAIATTSNPDDRKPGDGEPITPAELAKLLRDNPDLRFTVGRKPDDLEAMRRDAERFLWLTSKVEDINFDGIDPCDYATDEEESWTVLWRRAIDYAIAAEKKENPHD